MMKPELRIVSLLPSSTEIVYALGFGQALVGRSHECDYPPEVRALPPLTAPKFDTAGNSREIDARVKAVLQESEAVYTVDAAALQALQPDIIITQTQCDVCAVSFDEVQRVCEQYLSGTAHIIALEPHSLDDVFADIERVAEALGVAERGRRLVAELRGRMEAVAAQVAAQPKPRVATIEWIEPLMAAGNWVPTLVELAGGENVFGTAGEHSPWLAWEELVAADPEVLVIMPCGFDMARSQRELAALTARPEWGALRAVRAGRVYIADGNQYFNRPGPRLVESLEILAEMLHPQHCAFGHQGIGWSPFSD